MSLAGKHFIVTGDSRGIGYAITAQLLAAGARVTGLSRSGAADFLDNENYTAVAVDLSKLSVAETVFNQLRKSTESLDGIIANAGYGDFAKIEGFSAKRIRRLIDVNLTSQLLLLREFVPLLKKQRSGHVVLMGSEAALQGGQQGAVYSATKFALRGVAQSLREECSASGVAVSLVNPGMVKTGFFDALDFSPAASSDCHLLAVDVAKAVMDLLTTRPGAVVEEINLAPQKSVIDFGRS